MWERLEHYELKRRERGIGREPGPRPMPSLPAGIDQLPQIEHIVVLMMENHSYDNYFGMLRGRGEGFPLGDDGKPAVINDRGSWRTPDPAATGRGHGMMVAGQVVDQLQVSHPRLATPPGTGGTVVTLRHRLRRPATFASGIGSPAAAHDSAPPFTVDTSAYGANPRVRAAGPVDISTADRFARRLLAASAGGTLPLTVDLTNVTYLTSAGIRALYRVREQLAAHRQDLTLIAAPGSSVGLILELAQLPLAARGADRPR